MSNALQSPTPKRSQVSRACRRCRELRRACSDFRPCKRCIDQNLADQCLAFPGPVQLKASGRAAQLSRPPSETTAPSASAAPDHQSLPGQPCTQLQPPPEALVDYCIGRFFDKLFPTIPVLTPEYIAHLKAEASSPISGNATEAQNLLSAVCALILIQVEDSEDLFPHGPAGQSPSSYGTALFERTVEASRQVRPRATPSLEQCLLTFFIYACHAALLHHSQAFYHLREATTLWLLLKSRTDEDQLPDFTSLADRLFWVLLVSERSHAIRYHRPTTLVISPDSPPLEADPLLVGYTSLASLFRPLNSSFFSLLNEEQPATANASELLADVERAITSALPATEALHDTQKANLRVTQLWLFIIVWKLRLHLGHLQPESSRHALTYQHPLAVVRELTLSTRDLPIQSIMVHGVGLTEKLFDIASTVVDVLARVPVTPSPSVGGTIPDHDLDYLRRLIIRLPGGSAIYDKLLESHIEQALSQQDGHD
ncbi:hypothetical protein OQA88_6108 [Cercophora sp. LCS_1]